MAGLANLALATEYRTIKDDPIADFYAPCLGKSIWYRRAVGYFRSSIYAVIGRQVIEFAVRGGKINLICSPELDTKDIDEIANGYERRNAYLSSKLIAEFEVLLANERTRSAAETLASLIASSCLDIKIAIRADQQGIYHEKLGIFGDEFGNRVSFKGSANETWSGWHNSGNFESIEVFCDWRGGLEASRVDRHQAHFDSLWSETDPDVTVLDFPSQAREFILRSAEQNLEWLIRKPARPKLPLKSPLPHQRDALAAWRGQGCRGILEHATGTGKTFTAITAIKAHLDKGKPTIVLVPSQLLLKQWADELSEEVPDTTILLAGAGNAKWRRPLRLAGMTEDRDDLGRRIVLSTMATAASDEFRKRICEGGHLLVVADEVHQLGSPKNSNFLSVAAGAKLGLSATPNRHGDPEGTRRLFAYFGGVVEPRITLQDAIAMKRLVPYSYYPYAINLTAEEADEWREQTTQISRQVAMSPSDTSGQKLLTEKAKLLLIKRSRIAKKAENKIRVAQEIVREHYKDGQSWLVYCEDGAQLGEVMTALSAEGFDPVEYHTGMSGDPAATLDWFREFGGILVSIRCLDEGVDIPAVSHALILASSQNPRQFIQRRGRVLRLSPGKHQATLFDTIVTPVSAADEPEQMSLLRAELARAIEFADHATNKGAGAELRRIAIEMDLDTLTAELGVEVEDE